jgi:PKD repeat protein
MVKIELKKFVFFILVILFISLVAATFSLGKPNFSIDKSYGPGEDLKGWLNISFTNQKMNSSIQSSFGGSIKLIDLIKDRMNTNYVYTCNPATCNSAYMSSNEATEKNFNLNGNGSVLFGFLITGKSISEISDFGLNLQSNNPETEQIPLLIDILNDGQIDWTAYNSSNNFGEENSGCYKGIVGDIKTATIATDQAHQYCEKIELSMTPKTEIGAYISGSGSAEFTMSIKRIDEGNYKNCITTATGSGLQRISCFPDYKAEGGDYFVCIRKNNGAAYQINFETRNVCGFTGNYNYAYDNDFNLFARQGKFAPSINITLNDAELVKAKSHTENIERDINSYLTNVYRNNCTTGCIIPLKIYYNVGQNIKVSNPHMSYYSSGVFITDSANRLYDIQEVPPQINSKAQKLYLNNANFSVPDTYGNYTFSLSLEGNNILSDSISVAKVPTINSVTPTTTAVKYPTKFQVKVNSAESIVKYSWDFGDGKKQDTTINEISYTYDTVGRYTLAITVTDSKGKISSKSFDINVAPASEIAPGLLEETEANVAVIKGQIETLTYFEQESVNKLLDLENVDKKISDLKTSISIASTESDYEIILGKLLEIKVPSMIAETVSTSGIFFYPQEADINLDALASVTGDTYDSSKESTYKQSILAWNSENTNVELVYSEVSATYDNFEEPLLRVFDVRITNGGDQQAYLVMKDMENILFDKDYSDKKTDGYRYIELNGVEENLMFSTTENVDFTNLPMFVSPSISELVLTEWTPFEEGGGLKKWILFTIIIVLVLVITLVVWLVLQWWYKMKYETHLFKDRNNLYNLVNYIGNEKKKGTKENDIAAKLRKAGWNSEQLNYAIKKYNNKNTGMLEIIPLDKILNLFKKTSPKK